jgi:2-isopropylmalate synthase
MDVVDYAEHALGQGADANAVAYVETIARDGSPGGVGTHPNITASLRAVPGARTSAALTGAPRSARHCRKRPG